MGGTIQYIINNMKKLVVCLLCCSFVFSCKEPDDLANSIEGKWNVTQVIGGFSQPINYDFGDITWFFNLDNKTVTIENNVDVFNTYFIPSFSKNQGGVYNFEIITENNIDYFRVGDRKGIISFNEQGLMINYGIESDDFAYIFKR